MILNGQAKQSAVAQFGKPFQNFEGILSIYRLRETEHPLHACIRITDEIHLIWVFFFRSRGLREKSSLVCKGYKKRVHADAQSFQMKVKRVRYKEEHHWYAVINQNQVHELEHYCHKYSKNWLKHTSKICVAQSLVNKAKFQKTR